MLARFYDVFTLAQNGDADKLDKLLAKDVVTSNINARAFHGKAPLHLASKAGHFDCVVILCRTGIALCHILLQLIQLCTLLIHL